MFIDDVLVCIPHVAGYLGEVPLIAYIPPIQDIDKKAVIYIMYLINQPMLQFHVLDYAVFYIFLQTYHP